jgi:hypothetical protein
MGLNFGFEDNHPRTEKRRFQPIENKRVLTSKNRILTPRWERLDAITWRAKARSGRAAYAIDVAPSPLTGAWVALFQDMAYGPTSLSEAKTVALAMLRGRVIDDIHAIGPAPVSWLNRLAARVVWEAMAFTKCPHPRPCWAGRRCCVAGR